MARIIEASSFRGYLGAHLIIFTEEAFAGTAVRHKMVISLVFMPPWLGNALQAPTLEVLVGCEENFQSEK